MCGNLFYVFLLRLGAQLGLESARVLSFLHEQRELHARGCAGEESNATCFLQRVGSRLQLGPVRVLSFLYEECVPR